MFAVMIRHPPLFLADVRDRIEALAAPASGRLT
jgi:hypothetical protein